MKSGVITFEWCHVLCHIR